MFNQKEMKDECDYDCNTCSVSKGIDTCEFFSRQKRNTEEKFIERF